MLVLSRKVDDSIMIDENIEIKVIDIGSDQVKLGIVAPKEIKIYRTEIYKEIKQANKAAADNTLSLDKLKDLMSKKNNNEK